MGRRQAVIRKAMVVEERTNRKDTAQYTKEEIKGLENFLRRRFGMTSTEVAIVWREYGTAQIARMVHEEAIEIVLQTQAEELVINERKQLKQSEETSEVKQSEERRQAAHEAAIATGLPTKAHTQEEKLITKNQEQKSEAITQKEQQKPEEKMITKFCFPVIEEVSCSPL